MARKVVAMNGVDINYVCNGIEVFNVSMHIPMIPRIGEHVMLPLGHGGINRKVVVTDVVYIDSNNVMIIVGYDEPKNEKPKEDKKRV